MKIPALPLGTLFLNTGNLSKTFLVLASVGLGQWLLSDVIHLPGGGIGFLAVGASVFFLVQPLKARFKAPTSIQGWILRCN